MTSPRPHAPSAPADAVAPARSRRFVRAVAAIGFAVLAMGVGPCDEIGPSETLPGRGAGLFLSPQVQPLVLSGDGTLLYVANTTSGSISFVDVTDPRRPAVVAEVPVGLDPVSIAVRPRPVGGNERVGGDEQIFVSNHISDSISVVSRNQRAVVQTLQGLDEHQVTTTDEPVGIVFAGPDRAFVALDHPNQVLVIDIDAEGHARLRPERIAITAQAPRAMAAANGRLFVAAFESGNQTEFPSCDPNDPRGLDESDGWDQGCEFAAEVIENVGGEGGLLQLGTVFEFAAVNPNIGGRVIRDRDLPDRDLFVFDAATLAPLEVVEGVGTLLAGLAVGPQGRVYVTNTEANNDLDGLGAIDNRMFDNRITHLDCGVSCGAPVAVDLDAGAAGLGQTVPTPWGVAVSGDGETLVVTAAGADGDPRDGRQAMHGLFTLDADGNVQGSALVGALPEGVALQSDAQGRARWAYVLNTADSTVSVVDVSNPRRPRTRGKPLSVGADPTPEDVRLGRIAFHSGRGSTSGTFSCGSCHPNGNMDQLIWTINTVVGPDDGPNAVGELAEPRTTMPIRGLRDTLPLHWDGSLADPIETLNPLAPFDPAPDCDLSRDGEIVCVRHLVNAALNGPMCQHNGPDGCEPGPGQRGRRGSGLPGALTDRERDAMAAFQLAVLYPPSPGRRPTDQLSPAALAGVSDFFTNEDGLGINNGIGQAVNFAPATCADNPMGCHSLPLTVATNSAVVGGFDVPSARGMWDRFVLFSNGIFSSEEVLEMAQECADGNFPNPPEDPRLFFVSVDTSQPPDGIPDLVNFPVPISGDPCALQSPVIESGLFGNLALHPFVDEAGVAIPSGEEIYDPAVGMTERGSFVGTFEGIFALVYGVRGDRIWEYQLEIGVGLPGLTGRQISIDADNFASREVQATVAQLEMAASEGRITAIAHAAGLGELRYDPAIQRWASVPTKLDPPGKGKKKKKLKARKGKKKKLKAVKGKKKKSTKKLKSKKKSQGKKKGRSRRAAAQPMTTAELRDHCIEEGDVLTLTAVLPENVSIGGADRQPLLDIDPDLRAAEEIGDAPSLPRPPELEPATFRLGAKYVEADASVLVNGTACPRCGFTAATADNGESAIDLTLDPGLSAGVHVLQVLNPNGWASNEMPICVTDGETVCVD